MPYQYCMAYRNVPHFVSTKWSRYVQEWVSCPYGQYERYHTCQYTIPHQSVSLRHHQLQHIHFCTPSPFDICSCKIHILLFQFIVKFPKHCSTPAISLLAENTETSSVVLSYIKICSFRIGCNLFASSEHSHFTPQNLGTSILMSSVTLTSRRSSNQFATPMILSKCAERLMSSIGPGRMDSVQRPFSNQQRCLNLN